MIPLMEPSSSRYLFRPLNLFLLSILRILYCTNNKTKTDIFFVFFKQFYCHFFLNATTRNKYDKKYYTSIPSFYPFLNGFYHFITKNLSQTSLREISNAVNNVFQLLIPLFIAEFSFTEFL